MAVHTIETGMWEKEADWKRRVDAMSLCHTVDACKKATLGRLGTASETCARRFKTRQSRARKLIL